MSTTNLTAGTVMDRIASLMNDTAKTKYTYANMLPYLNMAIDSLMEEMEASDMSPTSVQTTYIVVTSGQTQITPDESATLPHYPTDLIEIQRLWERLNGSVNSFYPMTRRDGGLNYRSATESLIEWAWQNQIIQFVASGATTDREIQLDYIAIAMPQATDENTVLGMINAKSYLAFKGAAYCAMFIGENETRAGALDKEADDALNNALGISAKGRQQIFTRRRPFRSSYKARGWL